MIECMDSFCVACFLPKKDRSLLILLLVTLGSSGQ